MAIEDGDDDKGKVLRPTFERAENTPAATKIAELNTETTRRLADAGQMPELPNIAEFQKADDMAIRIVAAAEKDRFFDKAQALRDYQIGPAYPWKGLLEILTPGEHFEHVGMALLYAAAVEYQRRRR